MCIFKAQHLCKYFREGTGAEVRALDDVSIRISKGSFVALAGPSGSGKTTLLALLGTLERPSRGQVIFDGQASSEFSDVELARVRRRMGFVFQNFSLINKLSVLENIAYPLVPDGVPETKRREIAQDLCSRFGIEDKLDERAENLSSGEQQRVALARALARNPDVLLADEPTSNLDQQAGRELSALLQRIHAEGKTVLVASHDPEILSTAQTVYELEDGMIKRGPEPELDGDL